MNKGKCSCGNTFEVPTESDEIADLRKRGLYSLVFMGIDVGISETAHPFSCFDCRRKTSLEYIEKRISPSSDGKPNVEWSKYTQDKYINSVLIKLGIFSGDAEGNWIIMSQTHGCLNPKYSGRINLYFVSPDEAVEYADQMAHARHIHIMRVDQVFSASNKDM